MIVSHYTFFIANNNRFFLYNTLSNALIEIENDLFVILRAAKDKGEILEEQLPGKDVFETLCAKRFICESDKDELLFYRAAIQAVREQQEFMHLTIAPTMDCCFNCFYCFETNKSRNYMSEEVMDSIVKYVTKQTQLKKILLTWFGGEPLMAQKQMRQFYQKLRTSFQGTIEANIITTGFHIGNETISLFQDLNISSIQVTLDGDKETHNRIKHVDDCADVFSTVLNNIRLVTECLPNIQIAFRINLTKMNAKEYPKIAHKIDDLFSGKNVSISPGLVKQKNHKTRLQKSPKSIYFSNSEFAELIFTLFERHRLYTPFICYPGNELCECAIRDKMAISFDPDGYAYKCWERIGDRQFSIGRIQSEGIIADINIKELNRELYGADPFTSPICSGCRYLPICNGGCPIERIKNEFEGECNDTCTLYKEDIGKFVLYHVKMKELGYPVNN